MDAITQVPASSGDRPERRTISVPEAAKWLGISRGAAYAAAISGQIPTIRIGRLLRVPIVALERKLAEVAQ
jgi:excisionase family DNA binding protein